MCQFKNPIYIYIYIKEKEVKVNLTDEENCDSGRSRNLFQKFLAFFGGN